MATSFNTRISLKYDTYEQWHTNNPVLLKGELGIVEVPASTGVAQNEPTYLLKVGNGTDHFDDLKWISGTAADVYSWAKAATKPEYNASEIKNLDEYISGKVEDTDTQYQIVANGNMGFKLQSKPKTGREWTDVNTIALTPPTYNLIEGDENGTVKFGITGSEQSVKVHGLGSAAYTEAGAYDPAGTGASEAGKIKTALVGTVADTSNLDTIKGAKKYAEEKATAAQSTANSYTDSKIEELNMDQYATTGSVTSAIGAAKTELIGSGSGTASTIKGVYDEAKTYADQQIASKLGSVYKPSGSTNFADLPELGATIEGHVYNILDAFTTTEDFVEGASHKYPAGANIVCIDVGTDEFKWDVLSGAVDLSAYDTSAATQQKINAAKQEAISHADSLNSAMDGRVGALETKVGGSPVSDQITAAISGLEKEDSAVSNQFVTAVSQENGVISVTRAQPTIANITNLQSTLDEKTNDSDLHTVAKSGKIDDLTQTATIIFNCGTSSTIID